MIRYAGKDIALPLTPGAAFTLYRGSEPVYTGRTSLNDSSIYPNRIASRYLSQPGLDFSTGVTFHGGVCLNFGVLQTGSTTTVGSYVFLNASNGDYTEPSLSNPINGKLDPRMFALWTAASESEITFEIE